MNSLQPQQHWWISQHPACIFFFPPVDITEVQRAVELSYIVYCLELGVKSVKKERQWLHRVRLLTLVGSGGCWLGGTQRALGWVAKSLSLVGVVANVVLLQWVIWAEWFCSVPCSKCVLYSQWKTPNVSSSVATLSMVSGVWCIQPHLHPCLSICLPAYVSVSVSQNLSAPYHPTPL